ncbi:hypothetical protein [Bacillus infantis]|uniref:hypothetical protein n=1 Tax=Bacillus infantis TaxID=324767 RepID=UPI00215514C1|nr:hypothetical protein [Bacillus infantis]MCR6609449.1 hypothetical protein [Bacillus infantis]
MEMDYFSILFNAFIEVMPVLLEGFLPIILWISIPGIVMSMLFKSRDGYTVGAFLGLVGAFTIGPFSNNQIF